MIEDALALQFDRVTKVRPRRGTVLANVSIRVPAGGLTGVVGRNGSGKSTLLGLACGLILPTAGTVRVFGAPPNARRRGAPAAALVSAATELPGNSRVSEVLRFARARPISDSEDRWGLGSLVGKRVRELSDGERQRVSLCAAFARRPRLLLLDEPLRHLDNRYVDVAREEVESLLRRSPERDAVTVLVAAPEWRTHEVFRSTRVLVNYGRAFVNLSTRPGVDLRSTVSGPDARAAAEILRRAGFAVDEVLAAQVAVHARPIEVATALDKMSCDGLDIAIEGASPVDANVLIREGFLSP